MNTAKNTFPNILPIWQKIGESTYRIANFIANESGVKVTHTGVLDPMAEGVVIMLLGEERLKKQQHTDWLKEYEFDILFGISTDTYDGLGLVTSQNFDVKISKEELENVLQSLIGEYSQKVPVYSARKVDGKKLFEYPQSGQPAPELPIKTGTIHELSLINIEQKDLKEELHKIIEKINLVKIGEFRQKEIISQWINMEVNKKVYVATIKTTIARGLYVRSLSQDIANKLNSPAFISNLIRTKNGPYARQDCIGVCYTD